jgi:hypothetical protein
MVRSVGVGSMLLFALVASCGGLSTEDAEQRCTQLRTAVPSCVTDASYKECVSCYEECGDDCKPTAACPQTYACTE